MECPSPGHMNMAKDSDMGPDETGEKPFSEPIRAVLDALASLKFSAIQLTVHEGKLVQVDITERKRFSN
jgi:hypothetical protein